MGSVHSYYLFSSNGLVIFHVSGKSSYWFYHIAVGGISSFDRRMESRPENASSKEEKEIEKMKSQDIVL